MTTTTRTTTTTEFSSDCFARRCQIPSQFPTVSTISAIPNQLNSTPSSSDSDSDEEEVSQESQKSQESGIRSILDLEDYMNESALSVDGEFDVRVDIISIRPFAQSTSTSSSPPMFATAPPLFDYESDDTKQKKSKIAATKATTATTATTMLPHKADASNQETYKETCIICYEDIADNTDNTNENDGEINVPDFCITCKYNVHLDCIDEYRVNKLNDAVAERGGVSISSSSVGIKCLLCAREVERIYVRGNGDIDIVKNQIEPSNEDIFNPHPHSRHLPQHLSPQQRLQYEFMERRMRRERRNRFKQKCCNLCFFSLLAMSIAVILIMRFT